MQNDVFKRYLEAAVKRRAPEQRGRLAENLDDLHRALDQAILSVQKPVIEALTTLENEIGFADRATTPFVLIQYIKGNPDKFSGNPAFAFIYDINNLAMKAVLADREIRRIKSLNEAISASVFKRHGLQLGSSAGEIIIKICIEEETRQRLDRLFKTRNKNAEDANRAKDSNVSPFKSVRILRDPFNQAEAPYSQEAGIIADIAKTTRRPPGRVMPEEGRRAGLGHKAPNSKLWQPE